MKTMGPPCPHLRKPCLGQTERWRNGGLGSRPSHRSQEDSEKIENCSTYSRVRLVKGLTRFHRALSCQAFNKSRQSSRVGERECKRASGPGRLPCRAAGVVLVVHTRQALSLVRHSLQSLCQIGLPGRLCQTPARDSQTPNSM